MGCFCSKYAWFKRLLRDVFWWVYIVVRSLKSLKKARGVARFENFKKLPNVHNNHNLPNSYIFWWICRVKPLKYILLNVFKSYLQSKQAHKFVHKYTFTEESISNIFWSEYCWGRIGNKIESNNAYFKKVVYQNSRGLLLYREQTTNAPYNLQHHTSKNK